MTKVITYIKAYIFYILLVIIFFVRCVNICDNKLNYDMILFCLNDKASIIKKSRDSYVSNTIDKVRISMSNNVRKYLPSPHSELLLGIVVGINDLSKVPKFNDIVRSTGTIHVVVVSGYNISLVFSLIIGMLGTKYKFKNFFLAQILALMYSILSGFEPPVIRAWIMGLISSFGSYLGRSINIFDALVLSALIMLAYSPTYFVSLSFQLSFLATLGLVLYGDIFSNIFKSTNTLIVDLSTTLSAQVFVWPLISYVFESVNIISPVVNSLILWTIPLATIVGGIFLISTFINQSLAYIMSYFAIVPLDIFIRLGATFSKLPFSSIVFKPSVAFIFIYYIFALLIPIVYKKLLKKKKV